MLIRTKLFAAALAVAALVLSVTAFGALQAYKKLNQITAIEQRERDVTALAGVTDAMIHERALVQKHLDTRSKASDEVRAKLQADRVAAAQIVAAARQIIVQDDPDPEAAAKLAELRVAADAQLDPEVKKGNLKLRRIWNPALTSAIGRNIELNITLEDRLDSTTGSGLDRLRLLRQAFWRLNELVIRDIEAITPLVASGAPISIGDLEYLSEQAGRLGELRRQVEGDFEFASAALDSNLSELAKHLADGYQSQRQAVVLAGAQAQPFPFDTAQWKTLGDDVRASLQEAAQAIAQAIGQDIAAANALARQQLTLNLIGLAGVVLLAIGACWALQAQIVRPLGKVSDLVRRLAGGDLSVDLSMNGPGR